MANFVQRRKPLSCWLQWCCRECHCSSAPVQFMYLFLPDCHKLSAAALTKERGRWLQNVNSDQSLVSGNLAYVYTLQITLASSLSNLFQSFEKIKSESLVEDMKSPLFTLTGDVLYELMHLFTSQLNFMFRLATINNSIKARKSF